jgi:NitT/TauT family transport system permease protein
LAQEEVKIVATLSLLDRYFTPKRAIPRTVEIVTGLAVAGTVFACWWLATFTGFVSADFLPSPQDVWQSFVKKLGNGSLMKHVGVSLKEIYIGFLLSSLLAVPIGIFMGGFRIVSAAIEPLVNFMRYLPVTSMIPLLILWIGIGIEEKVAVIFLGTFFQQIVMISDVARGVQSDLFNVSYTLGATKRQVVTRVLMPATLPGVLDTLRITMGWAWTFLIVAELVAADSGLGYMILQSMRGLDPAGIFVGIFVIGLLGLLTDLIFKQIKRIALPWEHV